MVKRFEVTQDDNTTGTIIKEGTVVYDFMFHDYGLASDDSRYTGIEHVSVTMDPEGGYPSFTIPKHKLKEI